MIDYIKKHYDAGERPIYVDQSIMDLYNGFVGLEGKKTVPYMDTKVVLDCPCVVGQRHGCKEYAS